ncbi:Uncharacterized protein Adt_40123 [Abeliophyllum distichum]|uniref:Transposase (putative) gypsy type domain-containing protein n=1 Tax=Abeliophyllum distichum TaxID=126358 RepID=A0ABD1Q719_9LAMI
MSSSAIGGDTLGRVGGEASPSVSPSMEGVLPIRSVYGSTGEAIPIDAALFMVDVVRWSALDVPSIMVEEDLTKQRETYRIRAAIELILPGPNERACFSRRGCTALHLNAFVSGMCLPLHPMLQRILRAYDLALTQVTPNGWSQMVGGMYLWFRHSFGMEMALHVFQTIYQPRKLQKKKGREEEAGWYYFCPWGSHKPLVTGCPSSIKQWKESWFWVSGNWQRVFEDPEPDLDVPNVYGITTEMDQGKHPRPMLARLTKQRPKVLALGSAEDTSQRKVIEDLSREENIEAVGASTIIEVDDALEGEVPLSRKRNARASGTGTSQALGGGDGGPYDSKRRLRELIGTPGVRIPDDALRNLPFYPSMGAQAVKKYFTPKWEEFSSHGELEDVLETSLASGIRASTMQLKMEADLKEFDSNVLNLTKKLNNANVAQKVITEALEAANGKKRKEAEAGRKEVEVKLANAEADFVANFHNTEAYTNFSDYFSRVGQQEVLSALRKDHPNFNLGSLEARFPPPGMEGEEEN